MNGRVARADSLSIDADDGAGYGGEREEDEAEAAATLAALRQAGATAHAARADVSDGEAVTRLVDEMRTALGGPPEVLVNNAAVTHDGLLMMLPEAAWDREDFAAMDLWLEKARPALDDPELAWRWHHVRGLRAAQEPGGGPEAALSFARWCSA